MKSPFANLSRSQAIVRMVATAAMTHIEFAQRCRLFYDGDHWQNGEAWPGPIPSTTVAAYSDIKEEVRRVFCSKNVIKEVTDRRVDGLLKSVPRLEYSRKDPITEEVPLTPEQEKKLKQFNSLFMDWFTKRFGMSILKELYGRALLGEHPVLRIFIPRGYLQRTADGLTYIKAGTIEDMADIIYIQVLHTGQAGEIVDDDTQLRAIMSDVITPFRRYTEIVYVEEDDTVVRTMSDSISNALSPVAPVEVTPVENMDNDLGTEFHMKLGKLLTMFKPKIQPHISMQVVQNQMAINLAKTMQNKNTITAGFLERIILDAMPPGKWIPDPENPGTEKYEIGPFKVGGGTTNFFMAAEYRELDPSTGKMVSRFGNPSVYFRDPVAPSTFIESKRDCYQDILEEVQQPHILISGDSTPSGVSREQARETYRGSLEDDAGELNQMLIWLLEAFGSMICFLSNQPKYFEDIKGDAQCHLNLGPLPGTERADILAAVQSGLLSRRTAMERNGVENPQDELERIDCEEKDSLETKTKIATTLVQLTTAGAGLEAAAEYLGIDDATAKELATSDFVEADPNAPVPTPTPTPTPEVN